MNTKVSDEYKTTEAQRAYARAYYQQNKHKIRQAYMDRRAEILAIAKAKREANPELWKEYDRRYKAKHTPEEIAKRRLEYGRRPYVKAKKRLYYLKNKERLLEKTRAWQAENKERHRELNRKLWRENWRRYKATAAAKRKLLAVAAEKDQAGN